MTDNAIPLFALQKGIELVLASGSPRRQEFLRQWGLPYRVVRPHGVEPQPAPGQDPAQYTVEAARAKARAALQGIGGEACRRTLVVAADTIVSIDGKILGKPHDGQEALAMLTLLSGRAHSVTSAVCLECPHEDGTGNTAVREICFSDTASVHFHAWPEHVLAAYVATHEPDDKAGAYAIQGQGAFLVERVEGSWSTVVGLPLTPLAQQLLNLGIVSPAPSRCGNQGK